MQLTIDFPEDVIVSLQKHFGDLSKHTRETLAIEGYRAGVLGESQLRRMLGLRTRMHVDAFLKQAGVDYPYGSVEILHDIETNDRVLEVR